MLTIRTDKQIDEMIAYLRLHKVKFTPRLRDSISNELKLICLEFEYKKKINNMPKWAI